MSDPRLPATTSRRGLLLGLALGLPVLAVGVRGTFTEAARTHPAELAAWIAGSALVHDLLVIPAVGAAGWLGRRFVPAAAWPAVRAGLTASAVLALVSWPFVRGYGRDPANPSLLPRDYGGGVAVALAGTAVVTTAWAVAATVHARRGRAHRGREPAPTPPPDR